jgi:hypothetical protein
VKPSSITLKIVEIMPILEAIQSTLALNPDIFRLVKPAIVGWERLEGRPRNEKDFSRNLRAEIRDPLWMLCRQWQVGEFEGEDAGTAIESKFVLETTLLNTFTAANGQQEDYNDNIPLEVRVESERVHFDLFTQVQVGKTWAKLLKSEGLSSHLAAYVLQYPFTLDPSVLAQDYRDSDAETTQFLMLNQKRMPNGEALLNAIGSTDHATFIAGNPDKVALEALGKTLATLYKNIYHQPLSTTDDSWKPERLEYQFKVTLPETPQQLVQLNAEEYYQGHLDWYSFDINPTRQTVRNPILTPPKRVVNSYIPTPVQFNGMPNRRWWTFENGTVNLGNLNAQTSDLATLLFAEFALVFSNDWHYVPCELPVGSLNRIEGILVTDVFGIKTWVRPAGRGLDDDWHRWNMYNLNTEGIIAGQAADTRLFIPPAVVKTLDGEPHEEVRFIRDEMSNMVWAIEQRIPTDIGKSKDGNEAADAFVKYLKDKQLVPTPPLKPVDVDDPNPTASLRYVLGTTVPRQWIPFIPVKISTSSRQIRLQKAAMPEFLERSGGGYSPIVAGRTSFLTPPQYFLNEEEVPRTGIVVKKSFQRTRWYNGKVFTWVGKQKEVGRGEGTSGLAFDQLIPIQQR